MPASVSNRAARDKRHERIRLTLTGSGERPRLAVFRSLNQIYAQVIDDSAGKTVASASSLEKSVRDASGNKTEHAKVVADTRYHPARPEVAMDIPGGLTLKDIKLAPMVESAEAEKSLPKLVEKWRDTFGQ